MYIKRNVFNKIKNMIDFIYFLIKFMRIFIYYCNIILLEL